MSNPTYKPTIEVKQSNTGPFFIRIHWEEGYDNHAVLRPSNHRCLHPDTALYYLAQRIVDLEQEEDVYRGEIEAQARQIHDLEERLRASRSNVALLSERLDGPSSTACDDQLKGEPDDDT